MSDRGDAAISKVSRSARRAAAAAAVIVFIDRTTSLFHSRLYYARELQTPRRLRCQADRLAAKNVSEMTYFVPSTWDAERILTRSVSSNATPHLQPRCRIGRRQRRSMPAVIGHGFGLPVCFLCRRAMVLCGWEGSR